MLILLDTDDGFIDKIEFQFASFYHGQKDHASKKNTSYYYKCLYGILSYDYYYIGFR